MTEAPRVFLYNFRIHVFWRLGSSAMLIANVFSSFIVGSCWQSIVWDLKCFNSVCRRMICEFIPFAYQWRAVSLGRRVSLDSGLVGPTVISGTSVLLREISVSLEIGFLVL